MGRELRNCDLNGPYPCVALHRILLRRADLFQALRASYVCRKPDRDRECDPEFQRWRNHRAAGPIACWTPLGPFRGSRGFACGRLRHLVGGDLIDFFTEETDIKIRLQGLGE